MLSIEPKIPRPKIRANKTFTKASEFEICMTNTNRHVRIAHVWFFHKKENIYK